MSSSDSSVLAMHDSIISVSVSLAMPSASAERFTFTIPHALSTLFNSVSDGINVSCEATDEPNSSARSTVSQKFSSLAGVMNRLIVENDVPSPET